MEKLLFFALADDDLDLLASLLEENEATEERNSPEEEDAPEDEDGEPDEYDELFDAEDDASYTEEVDAEDSMIDEQKENLAMLFGDVDDLLEEEEAEKAVPASAPSQAKEKTNEELQGFCNSIFDVFCLIYSVSRELTGRRASGIILASFTSSPVPSPSGLIDRRFCPTSVEVIVEAELVTAFLCPDCVLDYIRKYFFMLRSAIISHLNCFMKNCQISRDLINPCMQWLPAVFIIILFLFPSFLAELRKLQEQMKTLQEQLQKTALGQQSSSGPEKKTPGKSPCPPLKERKVQKLQESSCFSAQLDNPLPPAKQGMQKSKASSAGTILSLPLLKTELLLKPYSSQQCGHIQDSVILLSAPGVICSQKPRVSSAEMDRKMANRKLIRLSQLKNKLATENLEEIDWVTFGVIVKKVTPQSANNKVIDETDLDMPWFCMFSGVKTSLFNVLPNFDVRKGRTFSIWRLNDLRDLNECVSLFLFGQVHKEHWKTDQGTVVGLLNANPMKSKEGSDEVCLSIDHPQKILLMGEALDMGTCKARKKNGDPCAQIVNLNDCEYCQYHIQSQYKKLSSKRADLQSTFSGGRIPKRVGRKNPTLKERLCQDGFYYGGVSSAAYAASVAAAAVPKRKIQTTLSNLVVKGSDAIVRETKQKIGAAKRPMQCSEEFRELLAQPTFGARNLSKHWTKTDAEKKQGANFQSISASALLKQQKQKLLEARKKRSEEIQRRPRLGTGFSEGEDILFFDKSPPPRPKLDSLAEAKKLAAIRRLRAKGQILPKTDPNSVKRKRTDVEDVLEIVERVEKSVAQPQNPEADNALKHLQCKADFTKENNNLPTWEGLNLFVSLEMDGLEPAQKKRREQLAYLESEEFQKILKAKSKHTDVLKEAEAELQEQYFEPLVKKEELEEKMRNIKAVKCRVVTCKTCNYTYFKPLETCVQDKHDYLWHDAIKRFFKCPCGGRAISLDRLPKKPC
ncbi:Protein MCM10, partial [Lonchura striata]